MLSNAARDAASRAERAVADGDGVAAIAAIKEIGGEAGAYLAERDWDDSSGALLKAAVAALPDADEVTREYMSHWLVARRGGEAPEVLESLHNGLVVEPRNVSARLRAAVLLRAAGNLDEARALLASTPTDLRGTAEVARQYAEVLVEAGEPESGLDVLESAGGQDLVIAFVTDRDWDGHSEGLLLSAVQRFPGVEDLLGQLLVYCSSDKMLDPDKAKDRVLAALDEVLTRDPDNLVARVAKVAELRSRDRIDEAMASIKDFPEAVRDEPAVAVQHAEVLVRRRRARKAVALLRRVGGRDLVEYFVRERRWDRHTGGLWRAVLAAFPGNEEARQDREYFRAQRRQQRAAERSLASAGRRAKVWRACLWLTRRLGSFVGRLPLLVLGLAVGAVVLLQAWWILLVYLLVLLVFAGWRARQRVVVADLVDNTAGGTPASDETTPTASMTAGSAALLAGHLQEIRELYRKVSESGPTATRVGREKSSSPTVALEDVGDILRAAVTADAQVGVGMLKLPLGWLMGVVGRLIQAPRLGGSLRGDDQGLVLTAELTVRGRDYAWRVQRPGAGRAEVNSMVEELAYRIFTDLALSGDHDWRATAHVTEALRDFLPCLITPRSRHLTLTRVERKLGEALAEDETFVPAYHTLGIVYMQRAAAGGSARADHLEAARAAFELTVAQDPGRWEGRYALAAALWQQIGVAPERGDELRGRVVEECERAIAARPPRASAARAYDLRGLAERQSGLPGAISSRRRACGKVMAAVALRQLSSRPDTHRLDALRGQAAQSLLNLAIAYVYGSRPGVWRRWWSRLRFRRRFASIEALFTLAASLTDDDADVHFEFGKAATVWGRHEIVRNELATAARTDPDRALIWAHLAQACVELRDARGAEYAARRSERAMIPGSPDAEDVRERLIDVGLDLRDSQAVNRLRRAKRLQLPGSGDPGADIGALEDVLYEWTLREDTGWESACVAQRLGERYQWTGRPRRAHALFELAIERVGSDHPDLRRLGLRGWSALALAHRGDIGEAVREGERAMALDPLSVWERKVLARIHMRGGDFEHAREAWHWALLRSPDDASLYEQLGQCCWALSDRIGNADTARTVRDEAAEHLSAALDLYPRRDVDDRLRVHYYLARIASDRNRFDEAVAHLQFIRISGDPKLAIVADLLLGEAYLSLGSLSDAEDHLERSISAGVRLLDEAGVGGSSADVAAAVAIDCGEAVGDRWPVGLVLAWAHTVLASAHARRGGDVKAALGHVRRARGYAQRLRSEVPEMADKIAAGALAARGRVRMEQGDVAAATADLRKSVAIQADSEAYLDLAVAYERTARRAADSVREDAIDQARAACECVRRMEREGPRLEAAAQLEQRLSEIAATRPGRSRAPRGR